MKGSDNMVFTNVNNISDTRMVNIWDNTEKIAESLYYGVEGILDDYSKALEKYLEAFYLGSPTATYMIGRIYLEESCVKSDKDLAIKYFKLGILRKDDRCWVQLGHIYANRNIKDAVNSFLEYLNSDGIKTQLYHSSADLELNVSIIFHTIFLYNKEKLHHDISEYEFSKIYNLLTPYKKLIIQNINNDLSYLDKIEDFSLVEIYENRLKYLMKE